jgi:uncharacterized protein HemX
MSDNTKDNSTPNTRVNLKHKIASFTNNMPSLSLADKQKVFNVILTVVLVIMIIFVITLSCNVHKNGKRFNKAKKQLANFSREFQTLKIEAADNAANNQTHQKKLAEITTSLNNLEDQQKHPQLQAELTNVKNLINLARANLKLNYNIDAAVAILSIAEETLRTTSQLELQTLRKNILGAIAQLKQIEQPNLVLIQSVLQEFSNKIEKLSLLDLVKVMQSNLLAKNSSLQPVSAVTLSKWQEISLNLKNNLSNLIKIRNIEGSESSFTKLLTEEQFNIIKTYFKLKVTEININIQQHNKLLFNQNMAELSRNTELYFSNNPAFKQSLLDLLNKIKNINITTDTDMDIPDLINLTSIDNKLEKIYKTKENS